MPLGLRKLGLPNTDLYPWDAKAYMKYKKQKELINSDTQYKYKLSLIDLLGIKKIELHLKKEKWRQQSTHSVTCLQLHLLTLSHRQPLRVPWP